MIGPHIQLLEEFSVPPHRTSLVAQGDFRFLLLLREGS
jgi:hypothetical protein